MRRGRSGTRRAAMMAGVLCLAAGNCSAGVVLRYDFAGEQPFIADRSGHGNHGLAVRAQRVQEEGRTCLRLEEGGYVRLPEAALVLGRRPLRGAVELSVKPEFDPTTLPTGVWEGWVVLIYFQRTSDNGLPDGYNEIGLAQHGPSLLAKVAGGQEAGPFVWLPGPLRQGRWTRLRMEWAPGRRALYIDGALAAESTAEFATPELDMMPAYLGRHPSSGKWGFVGLIADVTIEAD